MATLLDYPRTASILGAPAETGINDLAPVRQPSPMLSPMATRRPRPTNPLLDALHRRWGLNAAPAAPVDPWARYDPSRSLDFLHHIYGDRLDQYLNPEGDPRLYSALTEQARAEEGDRRRGALLGLRARGGDLPGSYGVAALLSDLNSESDLSRNLAGARERSMGANRDFLQGLAGQSLGQLGQFEQGTRDFYRQQSLQRQQQAYEERMANKAKKGALGRTLGAIGGAALGSFLGPIGTAAGTKVGAKLASGGVVDNPTLALIGDGGEREAVVPESSPGFRLLEQLGLLPDKVHGPATFGRERISGRNALGRLGSARDLGEADVVGDNEPMPEMPTPYSEPQAPRPHGFLEQFGTNLEQNPIPLDEHGDWLAALAASTANSFGHGAAQPFHERQAVAAGAAKNVERLNKLQEEGYKSNLTVREKKLEALARGRANAKTTVNVPGVGDVPSTSSVAQDYLKEQARKAGSIPRPANEDPAVIAQRTAREQRAVDAAERSARAADRQANSAEVRNVGTMADNIRQDPDIKDFVVVRDNFKRIRESAKLRSGQGDLSVIFAYMKVLDPTSVVREGEYKNAAEAVGKIQQLENVPKKWLSGNKLTDEGRAGFMRAAQTLYHAKKGDYDNAVSFYKNQARAFGLDPSIVIRNFAGTLEQPEAALAPPAVTPAPAAGAGKTVRMKAPSGQVRDVAADQVEHFKALGAKVVP
jgi:hypothetical protein